MRIEELLRDEVRAVRVPVGDLDRVRLRAGRRQQTWRTAGLLVLILVVGAAAMLQRPTTPLPAIDQLPAIGSEGSATFPLPPVGSVTPRHLDGFPVFVVRPSAADIRVLDAVSTHSVIPKVLSWCSEYRVFVDLAHGSKFDAFGGYIGGPAPTGMAPYEVSVRGDMMTVGRAEPAPPRPVSPSENVALLPPDQQPGTNFAAFCDGQLRVRPFGAADSIMVTHVGTTDAGPLDPDLNYPTPGGLLGTITELPDLDIKLLGLVDTPDPSLVPHMVKDQAGMDQIWRMFQVAGTAPRLPRGASGLFLPSSDTASCPTPQDVAALRQWQVTPHGAAPKLELSLLVTTHGDRDCEVTGVRKLYVLAVDGNLDIDEIDAMGVHVERS